MLEHLLNERQVVLVTEVIGDLVSQVSCGLQIIKIKSFLVAWCDEFMTAVSLDNRATTTEASKRSALEHRHWLDPLGLSKEELLHKHASLTFILINIKY